MSIRRAGRVAAVQILYGMDTADRFDAVDQSIDLFFTHFLEEAPRPEARSFAVALCRGVAARRAELDEIIGGAAKKWRVERMSAVDRNILRVAAHELTAAEPEPAAVIVDEAVELAKLLSGEASAAFVNGVLGRVVQDLGSDERGR